MGNSCSNCGMGKKEKMYEIDLNLGLDDTNITEKF